MMYDLSLDMGSAPCMRYKNTHPFTLMEQQGLVMCRSSPEVGECSVNGLASICIGLHIGDVKLQLAKVLLGLARTCLLCKLRGSIPPVLFCSS